MNQDIDNPFPGPVRRGGGFVRARLDCHGGFGGLENNKTQQTSNVYNQQVAVQGGSSGSIAVAIGGQNNTGNLTINAQNVDAGVVTALGNQLASLAGLAESQSAQTAQTDSLTTQALATDLGSIVGNFTPQSPAAQAELLAGTSPLGSPSGTGTTASGSFWQWVSSNQVADLAIVAGTLLSLLVYLRSKGRAAA